MPSSTRLASYHGGPPRRQLATLLAARARAWTTFGSSSRVAPSPQSRLVLSPRGLSERVRHKNSLILNSGCARPVNGLTEQTPSRGVGTHRNAKTPNGTHAMHGTVLSVLCGAARRRPGRPARLPRLIRSWSARRLARAHPWSMAQLHPGCARRHPCASSRPLSHRSLTRSRSCPLLTRRRGGPPPVR